jgi:hypothetical protein
MPAKKASGRTKAKSASEKNASAAKATTKKKNTTSKTTGKATKASGPSAKAVMRSSTPETRARRGDLIVIDSAQVGSPAREGEILKVIEGKLSVSYQVRWGDGRETMITPVAGIAHIVRT